MRDGTVAWLGRALGGAARRSVDIVRFPRDVLRRTFSKNGEGDGRADAQLFGGRIRYDRPRGSTRGAPSHADVTEALSHPNPAVRVRAIRALSTLARQRAEHLLGPMLHDPHPDVRAAAAEAAGDLGSNTAVFSLILGLEDGDENVREACHHAIREITGHTPWHGHPDAGARMQKVVELRAWWKEERMSLLARGTRG